MENGDSGDTNKQTIDYELYDIRESIKIDMSIKSLFICSATKVIS